MDTTGTKLSFKEVDIMYDPDTTRKKLSPKNIRIYFKGEKIVDTKKLPFGLYAFYGKGDYFIPQSKRFVTFALKGSNPRIVSSQSSTTIFLNHGEEYYFDISLLERTWSNRLVLGIHWSFAKISKDLSNGAELGFGIGTKLTYTPHRNLGFFMGAEWHRFESTFVGKEELDMKFSGGFIPVFGGIKYFIRPLFISSQFGMYFSEGDFNTNEWGFAPGIGFLLPIGKQKFEIAAQYNFIETGYVSVNLGFLLDIKKW